MATFKEAFRSARSSGKKTFTWNGKSYNTKLAEDTPKPRAKPTVQEPPKPRAKPKSETPKPTKKPNTTNNFERKKAAMEKSSAERNRARARPSARR